jgi:hypothetical protein
MPSRGVMSYKVMIKVQFIEYLFHARSYICIFSRPSIMISKLELKEGEINCSGHTAQLWQGTKVYLAPNSAYHTLLPT